MTAYLVAYRYKQGEVNFYRFLADDAEHALEQFRNAESDTTIKVVWIVKE